MERIDAARGAMPRSAFVRAAVEMVLEGVVHSPVLPPPAPSEQPPRVERDAVFSGPEIGEVRGGGCPWHLVEGSARFDGRRWVCAEKGCGRYANQHG